MLIYIPTVFNDLVGTIKIVYLDQLFSQGITFIYNWKVISWNNNAIVTAYTFVCDQASEASEKKSENTILAIAIP